LAEKIPLSDAKFKHEEGVNSLFLKIAGLSSSI